MRLIAILAGIYFGACASLAAAEVTINSSLTQTLEANSNYQLLTTPVLGPTFITNSTAFFDALAQTPNERLRTIADLAYRYYFGPGAETLEPGLYGGVRANYEKYDNTTVYSVTASSRIQQALAAQLAETGVRTVTGGNVITTFVDAGVRHQLTALDLLSWSGRATSIQNTGDGRPSSLDLTANASWSHSLDAVTRVSPNLQIESLAYGPPGQSVSFGSFSDPGSTKLNIWRAGIGLDTRPTKRLTIRGSMGLEQLKLDPGIAATVVNNFASPPSGGGLALDWYGDLLMTYKMTARDTVSLLAARAIGPDTLGQVRKFQNVGAILAHTINHYSSLNFSATYSQQTSIAAITNLYSAAVTYGYRPARDWNTFLTYSFRQRTGDLGPAKSSSILLSVKRDFTILPSTTARQQQPVLDPLDQLASPSEWAITRRFDPVVSGLAPVQY